MEAENKAPYSNLRAEMARNNVSIKDISELLKIHRNSVHKKLIGESSFTVDEALEIRDTFFKDMDIGYLFKR